MGSYLVEADRGKIHVAVSDNMREEDKYHVEMDNLESIDRWSSYYYRFLTSCSLYRIKTANKIVLPPLKKSITLLNSLQKIIFEFGGYIWDVIAKINAFCDRKPNRLETFMHNYFKDPFESLTTEYLSNPWRTLAVIGDVESRLASITPDMEDLKLMIIAYNSVEQSPNPMLAKMLKNCPIYCNLFNTLEIRRAIVPSVNGHFSARALARYYATLVAGGIVPPLPHSASKDTSTTEDHNRNSCQNDSLKKIFQNPNIHDAFLGLGQYKDMAPPNMCGGQPNVSFGLGFMKYHSEVGQSDFGHIGLGGSVRFCDIKHQFAIAVTVNKMTVGAVTQQIIQLVCSELNVPTPREFRT